ncbi:hypothetical protein D9M68_917130 [compost metagenome]
MCEKMLLKITSSTSVTATRAVSSGPRCIHASGIVSSTSVTLNTLARERGSMKWNSRMPG